MSCDYCCSEHFPSLLLRVVNTEMCVSVTCRSVQKEGWPVLHTHARFSVEAVLHTLCYGQLLGSSAHHKCV